MCQELRLPHPVIEKAILVMLARSPIKNRSLLKIGDCFNETRIISEEARSLQL